MRLKRIDIAGFKSFSGKESLYFDHPITAIVGPNGSGKSNIKEALAFVLGEQSLKSLRGKRGEDLIFNGSQHLPRLNRASINIVFDNSSRTIPSAFDEIEIERTVHRDSTNRYFINSTPVRRKDIHELLSRGKIGTGSHHTISQGEADRVLSLTSVERRSLIEESLGLFYPQAQKKEALNKLEQTYTNIREAEIRKREHLPHLHYLKREMEEIEQWQKTRKELSSLLRIYVPAKKTFFETEEKRLKKELGDTNTQLGELTRNLESLSIKVQGKQPHFDAEDIQRIKLRKNEVLRSLGRLEAYVESESTSSTNEPSRKEALNLLEHIRTIVEKTIENEEIYTLQRTLKDIQQSIDALCDHQSSQKETHPENEHTRHIDDLRNELQELERKEEELHTKKEAFYKEQAEQNASEEKEKALSQQQRSLQSFKSHLETQLKTLQESRDYFQGRIESWAFIVGSSAFLDQTSQQTTTTKTNLDELERRIEKLTAYIESKSVANTDETKRDFEKAQEHQSFLEREISDLEQTAQKLEKAIHELTNKINSTFTEGLTAINEHFNSYFQKMFGGRGAKLVETEVEASNRDTNVETVGGIDISVDLAHKKITSLAMLSGGERTLVSIALIFALSSATPPPFLVLDETDAALDEANSKRYGDLIAELSKKSQLILITHNRETMSRAGRLYGITMSKRANSELLSIDLSEAADLAR